MLWDVLDKIATVMDIIVGSIALWSVLLPSSFWGVVRKYMHGNLHSGGEEVDNIQADGVIFTVSKKETPLWTIDKVGPQRIHLIGSPQSNDAMAALKDYAHKKNIAFSEAELRDVDDVAESRRLVNHAIAQLQQHGCKEIVVDVTGGKTPMSIGAFQAGDEADLSVIYVSAPFDASLRVPDLNRAKIYVIREGSAKSTHSGA